MHGCAHPYERRLRQPRDNNKSLLYIIQVYRRDTTQATLKTPCIQRCISYVQVTDKKHSCLALPCLGLAFGCELHERVPPQNRHPTMLTKTSHILWCLSRWLPQTPARASSVCTRIAASSGAASKLRACTHACTQASHQPREKRKKKLYKKAIRTRKLSPRLAFRSAGPAAVRLGPMIKFAEPRQSESRKEPDPGRHEARRGGVRWGGEGEAVRRCEPFTVHRVVVRGRRERGVLVYEVCRWLAR